MLQCRAADAGAGQWPHHAEAEIAAIGRLLQSINALRPSRAREDRIYVFVEEVHPLAVAAIGAKCLRVEAPIVGRIIAINISGFGEVEFCADRNEMADDAVDQSLIVACADNASLNRASRAAS